MKEWQLVRIDYGTCYLLAHVRRVYQQRNGTVTARVQAYTRGWGNPPEARDMECSADGVWTSAGYPVTLCR